MPKTKQPELRVANLSIEQMKEAMPKIERRIADVDRLLPESISEFNDTRISTLENKLDTFLVATFGVDTIEYERYRKNFNHIYPGLWYSDITLEEIKSYFHKGLGNVKAQLMAIQSEFLEEIEDANGKIPTSVEAPTSLSNSSVFIVHGHDDGLKQNVARFVEKLLLKPVILHEKPNEGKTLIEKFEAHSNVGFAIILLTPDDVGGIVGQSNQKNRARQNVILEQGYFLGKLGRNRVCAIYVDSVELPSDLSGILYVKLDDGGAWKFRLAQEMKAAGMAIDFNLVA